MKITKKSPIFWCHFALPLILLASVFSAAAFADTTSIGRYLTVANKPRLAQVDLLQQTVQVHFPSSVQTIGNALQYILRFSGYSLIAPSHMSYALQNTLTKPLPVVDRDFGPMPLKIALTTLAGPVFTLITDPVNRNVNFRLKPRFAHVPLVN